MAIEVIKENFQSNKLKGTEEVQVLVETQIYLSPAKPEIEKLIWVKNRVDITDIRVITDKLIVTGRVKYDVLYRSPDEERNLHTMDTDVDFSEEIPIEGIGEAMEPYLDSKIEHTEWEIFENKIDLKSLINIRADVREIKEFELANEIQGEDSLQTLEESFNYREFFAQQISYANLQEEILIDEDLPEIDNILNFHIEVKELETIITEDRIITSADVIASLIYYGEDQIHSLEENFSLNHFIEMEGVDNSFIPKVKFEDIQGSYEIKANDLGESKLIDLDIKIKVVGEAYFENIQNLIIDAYSTKDSLDIQGEELELSETISSMDYEDEIELEIGEIDALEILSVESKLNNIQKYIEEDILIDSVLSLDIIYTERMTGELTRYSGDFPFRTTIDGNLDYDLEIKLESTIKDLQAITRKDGLEIIGRVNHNIELLKSRRVFGISNIEKGPETLSTHSKPSITVYIVQKGDTLWDIAKRYRTTMDMIQSLKDNDEELKIGDKIIIEKEVQDIEI